MKYLTKALPATAVAFHLAGCASTAADPDQAYPCAQWTSVEMVATESVEKPGALRHLGSSEIEYPASCRAAEIEGDVATTFAVDAAGEPNTVRITSGIGGECDMAAHRAVRSMRFEPAYTADGVAIASRWEASFRFDLACTGPRYQ